MKPRRLCGFVAILVVAGCNQPPQAAKGGPDPEPIQSSPTTPHDPNDYSGLRQFPLKNLLQSSVTVNGEEIPVWVMDTEPKRAEGFMYLRSQDAPDGHGMLFLLSTPEKRFKERGFWMRQCLMELDIAFMGPDKRVLNVAHGKVLDDTNLPAAGPYQYVLELKAGEAAKFGVKPGTLIDFPSQLQGKP